MKNYKHLMLVCSFILIIILSLTNFSFAASKVSVSLFDDGNDVTSHAVYSPEADVIDKSPGSNFMIKGDSDTAISEISYKWDDDFSFTTVKNPVYYISIPNYAVGSIHTLSIFAKDISGSISNTVMFSIHIVERVIPVITPTVVPHTVSPIKTLSGVTPPPTVSVIPAVTSTPITSVNPTSAPRTDELIIEDWMRENSKISTLAVSLRNDSSVVSKANKNIYSLHEEITYYVDFKNGEGDISNPVKLVLEFPLSTEILDMDGGSFDPEKNTITWSFDSMRKCYEGTKIVKVKYTYLSKSNKKSEVVYPRAKIYNNNLLKDVSSTVNYIYLNGDTKITESHEPYMYGDQNGKTFRPNDTITRAEGAIVLARILGISYSSIYVSGTEFSDILDTYPEAQRAIIAATRIGIINGYTDGTYKPNVTMTKAQFMKIIAAYIAYDASEKNIDGLEVKNENNTIKEYNNPVTRYLVGDSAVTEHWAINHINLMLRLNLIPISSTVKTIDLDREITRAEAVQIVNFYLNRGPVVDGTTSFVDVPKAHPLFADIVEATRPSHTYYLTQEGKEIEK